VPPPEGSSVWLTVSGRGPFDRADLEPVRRIERDHLVDDAVFPPEQAASFADAHAFAHGALRLDADRAVLPLRQASDIREQREDVLRRTIDVDLDVEAHAPRVGARPRPGVGLLLPAEPGFDPTPDDLPDLLKEARAV
jgi:hypothetical protein